MMMRPPGYTAGAPCGEQGPSPPVNTRYRLIGKRLFHIPCVCDTVNSTSLFLAPVSRAFSCVKVTGKQGSTGSVAFKIKGSIVVSFNSTIYVIQTGRLICCFSPSQIIKYIYNYGQLLHYLYLYCSHIQPFLSTRLLFLYVYCCAFFGIFYLYFVYVHIFINCNLWDGGKRHFDLPDNTTHIEIL